MNEQSSFEEKLKYISDTLFGADDMSVGEESVAEIEAKLKFKFPLPLKKFYIQFGKGGRLFDVCHNIYKLEELSVENNVMIFYEAHQGIWNIGINIETYELMHLQDDKMSVLESTPLEYQGLEELLLHILALQAVEGFFDSEASICGYEYSDDLENYLSKLCSGNFPVYCNKDKRIIATVLDDCDCDDRNIAFAGDEDNVYDLDIALFGDDEE